MVKQKTEPIQIPDRYLYEVVKGKPIYYKGWKQAFMEELETGKIQEMGTSNLQARLIMAIAAVLIRASIDQDYVLTGNEHGIHLGLNDNRCVDLAIWEKATFVDNKQYANIPPKIVIEVDIEADLAEWQDSEMNYYHQKTQDLLNFGVEKVIWVFTESKMVSVATADNPWLQYPWKESIEILNETQLCIAELM